MTEATQAKMRDQNQGKDQLQEVKLNIQRIYVRDSTFEAFNMPQMIQEEWKPNANIEARVRWDRLGDDRHEVVLTITVVVKNNDRTAFTAKVDQAGVFEVKGLKDEQLPRFMGSYCPSLLYPYAAEAITNMVTKGSFPQLYLAPMNFEAIYEQGLKNQEAQQKGQTVQTAQTMQTETTSVH